MAVKDFTNKNAVQLLATQSRRADISSIELCEIHFEIGKFIAHEMLDEFKLVTIEIQHVQGIKTGWELEDKNNIIIITLMRAGLYVAEGIRSVFKESQLVFHNEVEKIENELENKIIIIVDAVINTGKSIEKIIKYLQTTKVRKIFIATLVMQKDALQLTKKYSNISFYIFRISENKYVGKGFTDTGNRLFNTKNIDYF